MPKQHVDRLADMLHLLLSVSLELYGIEPLTRTEL